MEVSIIQSKIIEIRGQKVLLDRDFAQMYGVETKVLKGGLEPVFCGWVGGCLCENNCQLSIVHCKLFVSL